METHEHIPYLREAVIFLVAAGVIVPLFHRLRVSPVLGFLGAGAMLGPFGLGLFAQDIGVLRFAVIDDIEGVKGLAALGVIFLLFMIGLELSLERLWALRRLVFGLGTLQVVITALVIGAIAWGFGNTPQASIIFGSCLALSSTAIVMQLLTERRQVATTLGRTSFAVLLLQDLAVVPILFLLSVPGARLDGDVGLALLLSVAKALAAIALILVLGRLALRPLFRLVTAARSPELFVAAALLTIIGTAAVTAAAGLSMALGAFLAGLLLAETEFRHEIEVDIEPFKGLLLGLFFMSVGMAIDLRVVAQEPLLLPASVAGLFLIKSLITTLLCVAFGVPRHTAAEAGLLLGQAGEFAFVVVGIALMRGLVSADVAQFVLIVAGVTMAVTPLVAPLARRLAGFIERSEHAEGAGEGPQTAGLEGHVIVAGFGRVGQMLGRIFDAQNLPYIALDLDGMAVGAHRAAGLPVFYGDASRADILRRAHVESAQALVVTMDSPAAALHTVEAVRRQWPWLQIFARARDAAHARTLLQAGATGVVPETVESSLQLAARVLEGVGTPDEAVSTVISQQRELELGELESRRKVSSPG
jgi:CPA2 family monovalent cation:H+ antiporter-2